MPVLIGVLVIVKAWSNSDQIQAREKTHTLVSVKDSKERLNNVHVF